MFYPNGATAEEKQKINEAVFQMYMNDIFVGDGSGDLKLDEPIKRSEVIKLVIKPFFELDENLPQVMANIEDETGETETTVDIEINSYEVDVPNIVFAGNNERQYTITIPEMIHTDIVYVHTEV